jgi:hypothetical protein
MLSNIFLHHVLDKWFEDVVRPCMRGKATLVRFADDFVMTFETHYDAKRVMDVLGKQLGRFGLKLHPDKTSFIDFRPQRHGGTPPDCKARSFDFLGSWGKSRKGKNVVLVSGEMVDAISLKVPKLGGLRNTLAAARICEAAGIHYRLGATTASPPSKYWAACLAPSWSTAPKRCSQS